MKALKYTILSALIAAATTFQASAQAPDAAGGRQRGNFNPEEFRARMAERLKESLKVTAEEWTVIQPLIEKVTTKQRDAAGSRFGGGGGRPPGGNNGGTPAAAPTDRPARAGQTETDALRTTLENEASTATDIKAKLAALREVRKKSAAELAEAREELKKVLSVRQEAALVNMGILE